MEKFEVYSFDDVFYSVEELESMGLYYLSSSELRGNLAGKEKEDYEVHFHTPVSENIYSLEEYLDRLSDEEMVFFHDFGCHGVCVDIQKFYGIRFKQRCVLFAGEKARDREYDGLESTVLDQLYQLMNLDYVKDLSKNFREQEAVKQKQKKMLGIVHKN